MNIANNLVGVAKITVACALAGSVIGPLGASGGALAGLLGSVSLKCVDYASDVSLNNLKGYENEMKRTACKMNPDFFETAAIIGSVYAAAAIVAVPITIGGILATGVAALFTGFVITLVDELFREIFSDIYSSATSS